MAGTLADLFVKIGVNTAGFDAGIGRVKSGLTSLQGSLGSIDSAKLDAIAGTARNVGGAMTAIGAAGIAGFGLAANAAIEFESAIAGVQKTLGDSLSAADFSALTAQLQNLSTQIPVPANKLANIAEIAGQLGVDPSNVIAFTETIANLGAATNLTGEQAATALAQIINVSSATQSEVSNVGSALVALGNNSATTEADITNMATRLALAGTQAGLSTAEVLGFSASLASTGISAESGGTNFGKFISAINSGVVAGGDRLEAFAEVAGTSAEEFRASFQDNAAGAVTQFLTGVNKISESGGDAAGALDTLGFSGQETQRAILALSTRTGELNNTLELSRTAFSENTALAQEAATRYQTTESQLAILKNTVTALAVNIGGPLLTAINGFVAQAQPVIQAITDWVAKNPELSAGITLVGAGLSALLVTLGPIVAGIGLLIPALTAIGAPAGTVVAAIAAITAAIGGVLALVSTDSRFATPFKKAFEKARDGAGEIIDEISGIVSGLADLLTTIWDQTAIGDAFKIAFGIITSVAGGVITATIEVVKGALELLRGAINLVTGLIKGDWELAWEGLKTIVSGVFTAITGVITGAKDTIVNAVSSITDTVKERFQALGDDLIFNSIVPDMISGIGDEFRKLESSEMATPVDNAVSFVQTAFSGLKTGISDATGVVPTMTSAIKGDIDTMATDVAGTGGTIPTMAQNIKDAFDGIGGKLTGGLFSGGFTADGLKQKFTGILQSITDAFFTPLNNLIDDLVNQGISKLTDALGGVFGGGGSSGGVSVPTGGGSGGGVPTGGGGGGGGGGLGGVAGTIDIVSSVATAISSIISNFQLARQENTLNAIELENRQAKDLLRDQVRPALWQIAESVSFGPGVKAAEEGRDALVFMKDTIIPSLDTIKGTLSDIFGQLQFANASLDQIKVTLDPGSLPSDSFYGGPPVVVNVEGSVVAEEQLAQSVAAALSRNAIVLA